MPALSFSLAQPLGGTASPPCQQAIFFVPQHFLDLFDRIYPQDYLDSLKSPGPGYEVLQAYAQVASRVSLAVARLDCGAHILSSFGPMLAVASVNFSRDPAMAAALAETVTVKKGTVVSCSKSGRQFVVASDVVFPQNDAGPHATFVIATEAAWEYNVPGQVPLQNGTVLPGEIDTISLLIEDPPYSDISFTVSQPQSAFGGQPGMLDQLGADRGLPRANGETDPAYKDRIRTLPDTVSPGAIKRRVATQLGPFFGPGQHADFIETFDPRYQTAWDVAVGMAGFIDTNLFAYDDPRPPYPPFRNRWLGTEDMRAAFIVTVPNFNNIFDQGMFYDAPGNVPGDFVAPVTGGLRAMGAYDVLPTFPVPQGFYDGFDAAKQAIYQGLAALLDAIKAAGVFVAIELQVYGDNPALAEVDT